MSEQTQNHNEQLRLSDKPIITVKIVPKTNTDPFIGWNLEDIKSIGEYELSTSATINASVPISSGGTLNLRMWIADNAKPIRGALVGCHGLGMNWIDFGTRTAWRTLGQAHDFVVIGLYFNNSGGDPNNSGGMQALIDGINTLATIANHPELKTAPICVYGFSAGGGFAVKFAQFSPTRTISFAHNKGQSLVGAKFTGAALTVPGFVIYGSLDTTRIADIKNTFTYNRSVHAQWSLMVDWNRSHEEGGNAEPMALEYFGDLIEKRLPAGYVPGTTPTLVTINENNGWLGDNDTYDPGPAIFLEHGAYTGNVYTASWLADSYLAYKWSYTVSRTNKPNPPNPTPVLTSIAISPITVSINIGSTKQLTSTCKDQNNSTIQCPTLTWSTNNSPIATVNQSGLVTGISAGTANITASAGGKTSNISTITVTSTPPPPIGNMFNVYQLGKDGVTVVKSINGSQTIDQAIQTVTNAVNYASLKASACISECNVSGDQL